MKFGYHTLTWANAYKNYDIEQPIREIKESGFSGIEFVEPLSALGAAEDLKKILDREKMQPASLSCSLNMNPKDNNDIDQIKSHIKFAHTLGIKDVMLCGGWNSPDVQKKDGSYKILADKLDACCEYASKFKMNIAFHPHKNTIVETQEDIETFLRFTDKPKLCVDIAHLTACGSDPVEVMERFKGIVTYVHFKDWDIEKDVFVELGRGDVDIMKCLETLIKIGYDGWVVVELDHTATTPLASAKISADYLKKAGVL